MAERIVSPDRQRGRPRGNQRADVPEELIRALRETLAQKPAHEITVREIAASAGTSPEMVRYYFNGKDGLISALLDESLQRVQARLRKLQADVAAARDGHTHLIVACLCALYLEERESGKLFNSEFARARPFRDTTERIRRSDTIVEVLHRLLCELVQRGTYRSSLDPARMAILIMSLTGCPVRLLDTLEDRWIDERRLGDPAWIVEIVRMVEAGCLA